MLKTELKAVLEKHRLWRLGNKEGERANLPDANLTNASLARANLAGANLAWANLAWATREPFTLPSSIRVLQVTGGQFSVLIFSGSHVEIGCQAWSIAAFKVLKEFPDMDAKRFKRGKALVMALIAEAEES